MRWSTRTLLYITLAAALSTVALAQRGFGGGGFRGAAQAAPPSSTAIGAGASVGRAAFPSSTAIGAGAPTRSGFASTRGANFGGGYYGSGSGYNRARNGTGSRAGYGRNGRRDYRQVPFGYFLTPYYYPFLDYGSAPYGGAPEDLPEDPDGDAAMMAQNVLGEQIQRLAAEVEQLKSTQQTPVGQSFAPPRPPEPAPPVVPVTVVLRNGQKLQVQNYAVMGQTFWDFTKQPVRKIPISNIDVAASSEATSASGGEFPQLKSKP